MDEAKIQLEFFQKEYGEKQKRIVKKWKNSWFI